MRSVNEGVALVASAIARRVPFHYGWIVVFAGTLTVFSCLGLGRFGLGMLLPSMGADLGLSYTQMGTISTANFIGYLVSVVASPWMIKRFGESRTIVSGLFLVAASMAIISQGDGFLSGDLFLHADRLWQWRGQCADDGFGPPMVCQQSSGPGGRVYGYRRRFCHHLLRPVYTGCQ